MEGTVKQHRIYRYELIMTAGENLLVCYNRPIKH